MIAVNRDNEHAIAILIEIVTTTRFLKLRLQISHFPRFGVLFLVATQTILENHKQQLTYSSLSTGFLSLLSILLCAIFKIAILLSKRLLFFICT